MKRVFKNFKFLSFVPACLALSSCGSGSVQLAGSIGDISANSLTKGGLKFSQTLYPILKANCSSCHSKAQAPYIAVKDSARQSYDTIMDGRYVNFGAPASSKLVTKVRANHNCWSGDCASDAQTMEDQIGVWAIAEGVEEGGGFIPALQSSENTIPTTADSVAGADLDYVITSLATGNVGTLTLRVNVKLFDPTHYSISLRLRSSINVSLAVKTIVPVINGIEPSGDESLVATDYTLTPFPLTANNFLSIGGAVVPVGSLGIGSDVLKIAFETLALFDPAKLRFNNFLAVVQNSCSGGACHSVNRGSTAAFANFTTETQFINLSSAGGMFVVPRSSATSVAYIYTNTGSPDPMPRSGLNGTIANTIRTWIDGL